MAFCHWCTVVLVGKGSLGGTLTRAQENLGAVTEHGEDMQMMGKAKHRVKKYHVSSHCDHCS